MAENQQDAVRDGRHLMAQEDSGRPRIALNPKSFTLWLDPNEPWERGTMADELPDHPNYRYPRTDQQMLEAARSKGAFIPGESAGSYGDTLKCNPPHVHVSGNPYRGCNCGHIPPQERTGDSTI